MISISHRSPCYFLQIIFLVYIFGSVWYIVRRSTLLWPYTKDAAADGGITYTTGPRNNPNQLTVQLPAPGNHTARVNAGFVVLVRNSELHGMLDSMIDVEERFNKNFGYPWLFLNNEPFTEEFKQRTSAMTVGETHYAFVDSSMWSYPEWINQTLAAEKREELKDVPYGLSESYRHMCRFQSGFFWRHPRLLELGWEYYWRVEPDVRYFCELDYDPFLYMKQNNKKYAFTISFIEHGGTIQTLWPHVKQFVQIAHDAGKDYFSVPAKDSLYRFITDDQGKNYNQCHFWTNFEIARVDLWHSEAYQKLFEYLDRVGGFFYERWGDAPVHSIFASLFLRKDEVHYFHDIGYKHSTYQHCPESESLADRCYCNPADTLDYTDRVSCLTTYMDALESGNDEKRTVGGVLYNK